MNDTTNNSATSLVPVGYTAPSYWASYFINGDNSGMEDEEIKAADAFIESIGLGGPVDAKDEEEYSSRHDAWAYWPYSGSTATYVFLSKE